MIYSSNLSELHSKGYIDGHFPATIAPTASTTQIRNDLGKVRDTFNNATTAGMMIAIVNTASDAKPCPNLYDMINIVDTSGAPYFIFHSRYLDKTATFQGSNINNITRTCSGYSLGDIAPPLSEKPRTWLSSHPPSHPRLFNPLTVSSTLPGSYDFRDLNNDGVVDINDLFVIFLYFNESVTLPRPYYDLNSDGNVNVLDMVIISKKI